MKKEIFKKRVRDLIEIAIARGSIKGEFSETEIEYWQNTLFNCQNI